MVQLDGYAHWAETSPLKAPSLGWRAHYSPLYCGNEYLVFALGEETSARAVVGYIVRAFRSLKKTKESGAERQQLRDSYHMPPIFLYVLKPHTHCSHREVGAIVSAFDAAR